MVEYMQVPEPIKAACERLEAVIDKRGIWTYAEICRPGKSTLFTKYVDLKVGDLEQLAEYHRRKGVNAIWRFMQNYSKSSAKTAAEHIVRARLYRDRYHQLLGKDIDEHDMPFPVATVEEMRVFQERQASE